MNWKDRKVLVTGGSGFIGSHLIDALVASGAKIEMITRNASGLPWQDPTFGGQARIHLGDITDKDFVSWCVAQASPEIVFHLAAYRNPERRLDDIEPSIAINLMVTLHVLTALSQHKKNLCSVVCLGTSEEYGNGLTPFKEDQRERAVSPYSASKIAATYFAQMIQLNWGLPISIVRPFLTYGPRQKPVMFIPTLIQHCLQGKDFAMTAGDQTRDFVYVEDVVEGLMLAASNPKAVGEIINLGSGTEHRIIDVAQEIIRLTGSHIQLKAGTLVKRSGETEHFYSSARKASQLLGWKAKMPFKEGLKKTIDWYKKSREEDGARSLAASIEQSPRRDIRREVLSLVREFYAQRQREESPYVAGKSVIHYAGRVYDAEELVAGVDAVLDFWLTLGRYGRRFEEELKRFVGVKEALLTNSGSSANLLAICALTSSKLNRPLRKGDEVITPALTFPSTLAPIIQNGLVPVFVDVDLGTLNASIEVIEAAIGPKTRAIVLPHTLGNPFDLDSVVALAKKRELYLVEDTCDALGSLYNGKPVGGFGDFGTVSFYPAHHITMGEGGAVLTNSEELAKIAASFRDWGRDCWCLPGVSNTCGKRFDWQLGDLPRGYDHKYIYSHIGYNLKPTDIQAAIGTAQLKKLPQFIAARRANFKKLYEGLAAYEDLFILPSSHSKAQPAWFAFPLTVRPGCGLDYKTLVALLEQNKIETRPVFSGNILRHPAYRDIPHRISGNLKNTDFVMANTFFIGTYPGIGGEMLDYVLEVLKSAVRDR